MDVFPLLRLHEDILGVVFSSLSIHDLARLARCSKRFYRIASSNYVWRLRLSSDRLLPSIHTSEEENWSDLRKYLVFPRWNGWRRFCSPEPLGLCDSELQRVHKFFNLAASDLAYTHLLFRGKRYPIQRTEETSSFRYGWWWARPRCVLKVHTDDFFFHYFEPVSGAPTAVHAYVSPDNDPATRVTKTIARRRERFDGAGRALAEGGTRCPAAACVDGVVLRVAPPPLPLQPAPEAFHEPGFFKFVYRYAYIKFHDLCLLCCRNRSSNCNGDIPPFCRPCWLSHDLNLYMSAAQAKDEYGLEPGDLRGAHVHYKDNKRIAKKRHHFRDQIFPECDSTPHAPLSSSSSSPASVASSSAAAAAAADVCSDTPFYREFDVATLAILKWGSSAAVERKRREIAAQQHDAAKLAADVSVFDVEMLEQEKQSKRKRPLRSEYEEDGDWQPPAFTAETRKKARGGRGAIRAKSKRKAAKGKFYGEERNDLETRVDESAIASLVRWGL